MATQEAELRRLLFSLARERRMIPPVDSLLPSEIILQFQDQTLSLFERYRAMTSLVLMETIGYLEKGEAAPVFIRVLERPDDQELLLHDIVFYLVELTLDETDIDSLERVLQTSHSAVTRHEIAEALGHMWELGPQIAAKAAAVLSKFVDDPKTIVAQSCQLSLANIAWHLEHPLEE